MTYAAEKEKEKDWPEVIAFPPSTAPVESLHFFIPAENRGLKFYLGTSLCSPQSHEEIFTFACTISTP